MPGPYWKIVLLWNAITLLLFLALPYDARVWAVIGCAALMAVHLHRRHQQAKRDQHVQ